VTYLARRFWIAPDQWLGLADAGFLPDPDDEFARALNPAVTSFESIDSIDCLVLLGEPGLGKTTALAGERERLAAAAGSRLVHWVDLGATGQEQELRARIFGAPVYEEWLQGAATLDLLLDGLDEARLRVETIADLILDGLDEADFTRLRLRLTCRSADRHRRLEQVLETRFGSERFGVRELVPLRRTDVAATAAAAGLDPDAFVGEVVSRELQPLANRPLTLRFLVDAAGSEEGLALTAGELYRRGCRLLVTEPDEDRRSAARLDVAQRFAVGARIAAATILSGRAAVLLDESRAATADDADVVQLAGGHESTDAGHIFPVDETAVRETCGTGLFSARGDGRVGWSHQTLGEFLAADYLATRAMPTEQVFGLLTFREGERRKVIPQLREVAGWLATLSPPVFDELLPTDPEVLLRADVARFEDAQRAALVGALLTGVISGDIDQWDLRVRSNLGRLSHRELHDQLAPILNDASAQPQAREIAVTLASACRLEAAAETLAAVAVDEQAALALRTAAVLALADDWAPRPVVERIIPLAIDSVEGDADDELKGAALRAMWPTMLDAGQLFSALTSPKRRNLFGFYAAFLQRDAMAGLRDEDLPTALRWAASRRWGHDRTDGLSRLGEDILIRSWRHTDAPPVLAALVELVQALLVEGVEIVDAPRRELAQVFAEPLPRRAVVSALVTKAVAGDLDIDAVIYSRPSLVDGNDVPWLVEQLMLSLGTPDEAAWAQLVVGQLGRTPHLDLVMDARESSPVLDARTTHWFDAVQVGSAEAVAARERWYRARDLERQQSQAAVSSDTTDLVLSELALCEAGEADAFWRMNLAILGTSRGGPHPLLSADLTQLPAWATAEQDVRARIVAAAEWYLSTADPKPERWFETNMIFHPAWAGYRALVLLAGLAPDRLEALGPHPWRRWAPIIIAWPAGTDVERDNNAELVARCFTAAADVAAELFFRFLDRSIAQTGIAWGIARVARVDLTHLESGLLERVQNRTLPTESRTEILRFLIQRGSAAARELAERMVTLERDTDADTRAAAVATARVLIEDAADVGWPVVWPAFVADVEFGRAVVEAVSSLRHSGAPDRLDEGQLADLFEWLEREFPHAEDPTIPDIVYSPTSRDEVAWWRDQIVSRLASKGTRAALARLDELQSKFPELLWLVRLRRTAQDLVHRSEWTPPAPADVVRLGDRASRRWVTSDADLRDAVVESLNRAQRELQGAPPAAVDLWDTRTARPKNEGELSDWLKRWIANDLRGQGIVVGREVQLRAAPGGALGERPDLLIEAVAGERVDGADVVCVVVEVKGCWNRDLDIAMRSQLADRYLDSEQRRQGIYTVGWFAADNWTGCARRNLEESRAFFATKAAEISAAVGVDITAVTLDCSLPPRRGPARRT
jgi:hypothetical protein